MSSRYKTCHQFADTFNESMYQKRNMSFYDYLGYLASAKNYISMPTISRIYVSALILCRRRSGAFCQLGSPRMASMWSRAFGMDALWQRPLTAPVNWHSRRIAETTSSAACPLVKRRQRVSTFHTEIGRCTLLLWPDYFSYIRLALRMQYSQQDRGLSMSLWRSEAPFVYRWDARNNLWEIAS